MGIVRNQTTPPCLIAVVEDDFDIREAMTELLELEGYEVVAFCNGQEALEGLSGQDGPCIILLDWMMPVMTGEQFLRERSTYPGAAGQAPVLLVSTFAFDIPSLKGVNGVMKKPIHPSALLDALHIHGRIQCDRFLQPA